MIGVGPDLMIMWIGIDNYVGDTTFYFLICLIFIQIILWPSDAILVGTTQHQRYALVAVLEGFINIGLSIWWIHIWGVAGVAAASLTARLSTNAWYMFYQAYVVTGVGMTVLAGNVLKLFIAPISGVLIALFILNKIDLFGWYKIIINTSAICFIFVLLFYFLSLNGSDRHEIKKFIKNFGLI
jgi:hypothetical protein